MRSILLCVMLGSVAGVGWGDRWSAAYDVASALLRPFLPREIAIDRPMGCTTTRVSVASDWSEGNGRSEEPSISADGRYVAFSSYASNLVPGDTNKAKDIFVHDRETAVTTRVSVASDGTQGNKDSREPSISANGRYVAFSSYASNLVPGDTNQWCDVFVHDRQTGQTTRVSVASNGTQGNERSVDPSISADGRYVAFTSYATNLLPGFSLGWQVFVHDRQTGETTLASVASDGSQGDDASGAPSISADGRYVAFTSVASNLCMGGWEVFVHDRQTGQTTLVSVASDGSQGNDWSWEPSISADGRYVAFSSYATNLVPGTANGWQDIFVHDRQTGQTTQVSVASDGSVGRGESRCPSISGDGRYVAFSSEAKNLVPGDTNVWSDVFVHDRQTGETIRVNVASDGSQSEGESGVASISADGRYVAFESAGPLVPRDMNYTFDIFVHDLTSWVGWSVAGRVTLEDTPNNAGVRVRAMRGSTLVGEVETSETGWFQMNLAPGTYDIVPVAMDWTFTPAKRTVSVPPEATELEFTGKAPFILFDHRELAGPIQRYDHVTISGQVFQETLRPLANWVLRVNDGLGRVRSEIKTDDQGRFTYETQANAGRAAQIAFKVAPAPQPGFQGSLEGEPICWQGMYVNCVSRGSAYRTTCAAFRNLYVQNAGSAPLLVTTIAGEAEGAASSSAQVKTMVAPGETAMVLKSTPHRDHQGFKCAAYVGAVRIPEGVVQVTHTADGDGVVQASSSAAFTSLRIQSYSTSRGDVKVCWAPEAGIPLPTMEASGEVVFCMGISAPALSVGAEVPLLTAGYTLKFNPGTSIISDRTPADGEQGYTREGKVSILFKPEEHIKEASAREHFHLYDASGMEVNGRCWSLRENQAEDLQFLPGERLAPNKSYTAYLAPGIERTDGTTVDWAEWFEFTTNGNPWVSRCSPKDGYVGIRQSGKVRLEFDGPVDLDKTQASFRLFDGAGNRVPGTVIWTTGGNGFKALTFVSKQPLWHDSKHKIVVQPYPLAPAEPDGGKFTAEFTVGSGILATHYPDRNAKRVPRDAEIVINFWRKVWPGSTFEHFKLAPKGGQAVVGTPTLSGANLQFCFRPMVPLKPDTKYQATLEAGVKLKDGGVTTEAYAWEFWTAPETSSGAHVVATAVPTARGVEIVATLTGEARVSVNIMNMAGRIVRQVVTDRPAPAGKTVFLWNGYDDRGLRVPAGMYLVCVEARSESGTVERALTTVRVDGR